MSDTWKEHSTPIVKILGLALILAFTQVAQQSDYSASPISGAADPCETKSECRPRAFVNLAFIIDRSGSMDPSKRGQTFNMQIEGVLRSLADDTVIPRDGSVAISVVTFAEEATVQFKLTEIKSQKDAEDAASKIAAFKCACGAANSCPAGATNFGPAIREAYKDLLQGENDQRKNARRVLLLSSDGGCTDIDSNEHCKADAVEEARSNAARSGTEFEMDTILVGLDPVNGRKEFEESKNRVAGIASPPPAEDLPGATLHIDAGECNNPAQCASVKDCVDQANLFAEKVRSILKSDVRPIQLTVRIADDTPADETVETITGKESLSLRQAIKLANANGGNATITFDGNVKTIRPGPPLPALTQPEITIDGGERKEEDLLTIDGSMVKPQEGEQHENGLLIRSNRITIRRIKVANFPGAGIAIAPLSRCDSAKLNIISHNHLENNKKAGILLLDSPCQGPGNNLRNTLSDNTISGQSIPIDLGGDGPTQNDPCDADEGPNHRLNFPGSLSQTVEGNRVIITGRAGGEACAAAGATIEIFTVSPITQSSTQSAVRTVTRVASVSANSDGFFTASIPGDSITEYTATVTDSDGNTSELLPLCETGPRAVFDGERLEFNSEVARDRLKLNKQAAEVFTITNSGCSMLVLTFGPITRDGDVRISETVDNLDGRGLFSVKRVIDRNDPAKDQEIPSMGIGSLIAPDQQSSFRVRFNPIIPVVVDHTTVKTITASEVLPDRVTSFLTVSDNTGAKTRIALVGTVGTAPILINPIGKRRRPPVLNFARSEDNLNVQFSVYDSDKRAKVRYRFFDAAGNETIPDSNTTDLSTVEGVKDLIKGQSFTIKQTFTNAKEHTDVCKVNVVVCDEDCDKPGNDSAETSFCGKGSTAAFLRAANAGLSKPTPLKAGNARVFRMTSRASWNGRKESTK